ncbi:MAG: hypothetical protein J3K34DRAFT_456511 [Monoraphidium minutum]|nr:MAG: hypothetical protein J3K34DRAFT_456511 [Monoraphidium minutum]
MNGEEALRVLEARVDTAWPQEWRASCRTHHPGWLFKTWDARSARELAARDFPFLLPAFDSYAHPVQRADAARWMVMYQFGGVYADTDVECLAPAGPSLAGRDLVFNCEEAPGAKDAPGNAVIASTPRNPFWLDVMREAMARADDPAYSAHDNGFVRVLATTGPWMVGDVLRRFLGLGPDGRFCGAALEAHGVRVAAYPVGSWFTPCAPMDAACEM